MCAALIIFERYNKTGMLYRCSTCFMEKRQKNIFQITKKTPYLRDVGWFKWSIIFTFFNDFFFCFVVAMSDLVHNVEAIYIAYKNIPRKDLLTVNLKADETILPYVSTHNPRNPEAYTLSISIYRSCMQIQK